jgi:class 3 adenylate cyclase
VRFRQALALWRGPALADLLDAPAAQAEATRLEEARLAAVEERVDADLASGAHGELAAELEALTRAYPLRERLWAQRMVALYRSGRQAEALRVYQDLRRILGEELGLEPSAALAGVEVAILRHDAALDWRPAQSAVSASAGTPPPATSGGVVTFLFTDLVGSTALLDRLGEDAFDDLRRTHFSLLRQAVSDAGGHEVKNLGDGIMVAFASPVAALGAAIAIQRAVAEHNRSSADRALSLRVGLQSGEATREESDFFGTAVVVAKRLCDQAPGGRIFAGELVAALVGSRGAYQFRPLGHLSLKGLATPVPAVEVDWQPVPSSVTTDADAASPGPPAPVPLPRLLTGIGRVFVGRDGELERLRIAWKAAAGSGPRLVMVAGEPGVGKTRLTAALAAEVHAEGATVLAGRCDEDLGVPYQPFVHALRHLVDHTPGSHLSRRLGRYGGELTRLVPDLTERAPGLGAPLHADPETEQYRLFDAVAAWLDATAAEAPLLLVLDDLQWAAKPTLLLLRHIVRTGEHRLLIVGTYRDTELSRTHPLSGLLADLRRDGEAERIALTGLDAAGVAAFLEQAAGNELSEDDWELARAIHGETEGNPFFVGEVVRHLVESGAVVRRDGRWVTEAPINELGIPEGVRDVVGRRLSRLSEAANQLLAIAAVVGLEFDPAVVEAAGGADEDTVAASLDEAVAARLVTPAGGVHYRFAHALVRTTLYDELTPARRVILHRRTAEAIETIHAVRLDDYLPALTHHYSRATAPVATAEKAVGYARRAGDRALEQLAHDEAVAYYRQALELLEASEAPLDETQRTELLIALGEAQRRAGDTGHRETLLAAARLAASRADAAALARAALANSPGSKPAAFGVTDSDRVEVLEAAAAAVGNGDSATRARLLAILALELFHDADRRRRLALSDEALAIARRLGDPVTLAQVLVARPFAIGGPDTLGERLANTTELLDVAERLGDPVTAHRAWWLRFRVAVEVADRAEADRCLQAQQPLVAELGQPVFSWMTNLQRIAGHFRAGRIGEAEPLLYAAFDEGQRAGQADAALYFAIHLFHLGYEQGRLAEFRGPLMEVFERPSQLPFVGATRAVVHCELGDLDAARAELEQLASVDFGDLQIEASWVVALCYCAVACAALDDRERAGALVRLLEPYADHVAVFAVGLGIGCVSHYLGLLTTTLGRLDEADVHFTNACAVHGRMDAPGWLARTHLEWGRVLLHRRQRSEEDRARELLGQAVSTARELGLTGVERRAVELLA